MKPSEDEVAAFRLGERAAFAPPAEPGVTGRTKTTLVSWWNHLLCGTCGHTFRRGDWVSQDAETSVVVHLDPALGCAGDPAEEDATVQPEAGDLGEFTDGISATWPPAGRAPVTLLQRGDWRVARPRPPAERARCLYCAHTFRAGEYVVVCPCDPARPGVRGGRAPRSSRRAGLLGKLAADRPGQAVPGDVRPASAGGAMTGLLAGVADADRYARHRAIPGWDQGRLGQATAIVAGVGALGNEVAKNLALAGVGRLVLCDPDVVAVSNLSRTVLFQPETSAPDTSAPDTATPDSAGRAKVEAAAGSLRRLVPGIAVETRQADLATGIGLGELASAAVVLGCLDTRQARLRLLGRCALVEAPLVDGGTVAWGGEVRLRLDTGEPCYGCALTPHQRGASDLPWSCDDVARDEPAAASIASSALIAAWMTIAALRVIFGTPPDYRAVRVDALSGQAWPVETTRDPSCPHHQPIGPARDLDLTYRCTVADLIGRAATRCRAAQLDRVHPGRGLRQVRRAFRGGPVPRRQQRALQAVRPAYPATAEPADQGRGGHGCPPRPRGGATRHCDGKNAGRGFSLGTPQPVRRNRQAPRPVARPADLAMSEDDWLALRDAMANVFDQEVSAGNILDRIRFPPRHRPAWNGNSELVWGQVFTALENGIIQFPRRQLLGAALTVYPYNATFLDLGQRHGVTGANAPPEIRDDPAEGPAKSKPAKNQPARSKPAKNQPLPRITAPATSSSGPGRRQSAALPPRFSAGSASTRGMCGPPRTPPRSGSAQTIPPGCAGCLTRPG